MSLVADNSLACVECKYALVGLEMGGRCPECGLHIAISVRESALFDHLSRRISGSLLLLVLGQLMLLGFMAIGALPYVRGGWLVTAWSLIASYQILVLFGFLRLAKTLAELDAAPGLDKAQAAWKAHALVVVFVVLMFAAGRGVLSSTNIGVISFGVMAAFIVLFRIVMGFSFLTKIEDAFHRSRTLGQVFLCLVAASVLSVFVLPDGTGPVFIATAAFHLFRLAFLWQGVRQMHKQFVRRMKVAHG